MVFAERPSLFVAGRVTMECFDYSPAVQAADLVFVDDLEVDPFSLGPRDAVAVALGGPSSLLTPSTVVSGTIWMESKDDWAFGILLFPLPDDGIIFSVGHFPHGNFLKQVGRVVDS